MRPRAPVLPCACPLAPFPSTAPSAVAVAAHSAPAAKRFGADRVGLGQGLADAVGDGLHLEGRAGDLLQQLVRVHALALRPELAQERAGLAPREPRRPEPLLQEGAQLRLERP